MEKDLSIIKPNYECVTSANLIIEQIYIYMAKVKQNNTWMYTKRLEQIMYL